MKVGAITLGCKANAYDTESVLSLFEKRGYEIVREHGFADIYIINTCAVTNVAERKSRQAVERVLKQNPDAVIIMTGCYAQVKPLQVKELKNVAIVCGTRDRAKIVDMTEEYLKSNQKALAVTDSAKNYTFEDVDIVRFEGKTRVQLKIQDGCNNFCSYCIIPYARGRACSKPMERVLEQVDRIIAQDIKEIVLTGIHIASYGKDIGGYGLTELLEAIHQRTEDTGVRIRLGSLDPRVVTEDFVKRISVLDRICPQFHLSLQSGCNTVLERMNRHYTAEEYMAGVELLRRYFDSPSITTDIIVGFPGETEEEFAQTLAFAQRVGFAKIHIFPYSRRDGTVAAKMKDQIPKSVSSEREKRLSAVESATRGAYIAATVGKRVQVLFEEEKNVDGENCFCGYTPQYVYVGVKGQKGLENTVRWVKIIGYNDELAIGELEEGV